MKRNSFTKDEIILCTYAAMYDVEDIGGIFEIGKLTHRSLASIKMKIQNIASMLDDAGIKRKSSESPLTGLPHGQTGRKTNWNDVEPLSKVPRILFLQKCQEIFSK